MSTELKSIFGKIEIPDKVRLKSSYVSREVNLTSFYGGKERGHSLQISFLNANNESCFIQLDNENVKELINTLKGVYSM